MLIHLAAKGLLKVALGDEKRNDLRLFLFVARTRIELVSRV